MSNTITELRNALTDYTLEHGANEIPYDYYETIVETWKNMNAQGYNWDRNNAAAALLYASIIDGIVQDNQITTQGYNAINWAEHFLDKIDVATTV